MYNGSSLARDKVGYKFFFQDAYQEGCFDTSKSSTQAMFTKYLLILSNTVGAAYCNHFGPGQKW